MCFIKRSHSNVSSENLSVGPSSALTQMCALPTPESYKRYTKQTWMLWEVGDITTLRSGQKKWKLKADLTSSLHRSTKKGAEQRWVQWGKGASWQTVCGILVVRDREGS